MQSQSVEFSIYPDGRMDPKNAALYVGLAEKTLAIKRSNGTGPRYIKPGNKIFYYKADLDAWLNQIEPVTSTAQERAKRKAYV